MLTDQEISAVKKSWARLRNIDPVVIGDAFYSKLFFERPALRRMFPVEMDAQYKKLVDMLNTIVTRLDHLDELTGVRWKIWPRQSSADASDIDTLVDQSVQMPQR